MTWPLLPYLITLTSVTFFVALCDRSVFLIPRVSKYYVEDDLAAEVSISCYAPQCSVDAEMGADTVLKQHLLKNLESKNVTVPILIIPDMRMDKSHYLKITSDESVTVVVGHSAGSADSRFYNIFKACPVSSDGSIFIVTLPMTIDWFHPFTLIIAPEETEIEVLGTSKSTTKATKFVIKAERETMHFWEERTKKISLQGAVIKTSRGIALYIGNELVQGPLPPRKDWGTKFAIVVPRTTKHITLYHNLYVTSDIHVNETYKRANGKFPIRKSRHIPGPDKGGTGVKANVGIMRLPKEYYVSAPEPIGVVFVILDEADKYSFPFAALPPYQYWPQEIYLSIPYEHIDIPRQIIILALTENFNRILVNMQPVSERITQLVQFAAEKYSYGFIDHNENMFFTLAHPEYFYDVTFSITMYGLVSDQGLYFADLTSGINVERKMSSPKTDHTEEPNITTTRAVANVSLVPARGRAPFKRPAPCVAYPLLLVAWGLFLLLLIILLAYFSYRLWRNRQRTQDGEKQDRNMT